MLSVISSIDNYDQVMIISGGAVAAYAERFIGVREDPPHSNSGSVVHQFQSATGAYNAPWCISFIQFVLKQIGVGPVANKTAGAYYLRDYAVSHGWAVPKPAVGCGAVFQEGAGHGDIVVAVGKNGAFTTVDGNYNDQVQKVERTVKQHPVTFFRFPHVQYDAVVPKPKPKVSVPVFPRSERVTSSNGNDVHRVGWYFLKAL